MSQLCPEIHIHQWLMQVGKYLLFAALTKFHGKLGLDVLSRLFLYGGCGANTNNYRTYQACDAACRQVMWILKMLWILR